MATKEARQRASAAYHEKRKDEGWRKLAFWLSPDTLKLLEKAKAEHGSGDAAIAAALKALVGDQGE